MLEGTTGRARRFDLPLGVLFLTGGLVNLLSLPHPVWFWVLGIAVFLPSAYLGAKLGASAVPKDRSLAEA